MSEIGLARRVELEFRFRPFVGTLWHVTRRCLVFGAVVGWLSRENGRLQQISNLQARCANIVCVFVPAGLWRLYRRKAMHGDAWE